MAAAGGNTDLLICDARAKCVKGLIVVEMTVGLLANAPVQSCTVRCRICRIVAEAGTAEDTDWGHPKIDMRLFIGPLCSVAASRDSGAGRLAFPTCIHGASEADVWDQANQPVNLVFMLWPACRVMIETSVMGHQEDRCLALLCKMCRKPGTTLTGSSMAREPRRA